ncbi:hypothetical protein [Streptomyces sp. NBC_01565]|uniref:hypothetical protein n=1 Tax=unclassified Streptomyces TaxID=2593676 RepID=UPI00224EACC1|nr:hypothetical protein [Streptomyces sp. NBC_01565]MCX4539600.1 hypothetical protein [Streptomyces sp. NBC_01565]
MYVRPRLVIASAVLSATLVACAGQSPAEPQAPGPVSAAASATPSARASASPAVSPAASPSAMADPPSAVPTSAPPRSSAPPVARTGLTMTVATKGGRLDLVRGGPAQEFTVTLRGGNSREYRHLLLAFQMEPLVAGPGDTPGTGAGFVLERRDPTTGAWRSAELRIAGDHKPYGLYAGGAALARDAVRTERYRLRATSGGPAGSTPVMISAIDTDAPAGASQARERPGYFSLPQTTRRP